MLLTLLAHLHFFVLDAGRLRQAEIKTNVQSLHEIATSISETDSTSKKKELVLRFDSSLDKLKGRVDSLKWPGVLRFDLLETETLWAEIKPTLPTKQGVRMTAKTLTFFKIDERPSDKIPDDSKCKMERGAVIFVDKYPPESENHAQVTLSESIPKCAFGKQGKRGFIFFGHWEVP